MDSRASAVSPFPSIESYAFLSGLREFEAAGRIILAERLEEFE